MEIKMLILATYCGYDGCLSGRNVFGILQDAITKTVGAAGCDGFAMKEKYHAMWVFTKQKAKVFRRPHWDETIRIHCRIVKATRLVCYLRTSVYDEQDNLIIDGMTESCILDKTTFRFVRLNTIPSLPMEEEECDTDFVFEEFEPENEFRGKVTYSLVDMSMHLNNALALTPVLDVLPFDDIREIESHPYEIGIKYTNQALFGTEFKIHTKKIKQGYLFSYMEGEKNLETGYLKW